MIYGLYELYEQLERLKNKDKQDIFICTPKWLAPNAFIYMAVIYRPPWPTLYQHRFHAHGADFAQTWNRWHWLVVTAV